MSARDLLRPVTDAFRGEKFKPTLILLVSPLILTTWKYYGSPAFYLDVLQPRLGFCVDPQATAAIYSFLACFVLMGGLPALIVKLVFHERLADYGVQWGNRLLTLRSFLILAPIFVLSAYVGSKDPAFLEQYPVNKNAGVSPGMFAVHAAGYFTFYVGWEFYFRGFMQFGLRRAMGDVNTILVQVLVSCIFHLGKPAPEIYGSIFGALLWGVLAFRTRSLLSGMLQHFLLGIGLDWLICYTR